MTYSAFDDYADVRLTLSEWAAVITATEKQADAEATVDGEALYRALSSRIVAKVQGTGCGPRNRQAAVAAVQSYLASPSWAHSPYLGVQATEIVDLVLSSSK
ncbi:MAG: hypothetical protein ABWZ77_05215 [Naasia sp.]